MKKGMLLLLTGICLFTACKDKEDIPPQDQNGTLKLNLTGLEDAGANQRYEGWIMVNGSPVSTGTFSVNQSGTPSATSFTVSQSKLNAATAFILTIEPTPDPDPMPSNIKVLAGDFSSNNASLRAGHSAALGNAFTGATGKFLLATPTTAVTTDEKKGVWFIDNSGGTMKPGFMNLPALGNNWKYEGWIIINNMPVSTGTFRMAAGADEAAPFSGTTGMTPPFPGEDLIMNAPAGVTFPADLSGSKVVVTIEPSPDNSPMPFMLKPLAGTIPANAAPDTNYNLMNQAETAFPKGTASR